MNMYTSKVCAPPKRCAHRTSVRLGLNKDTPLIARDESIPPEKDDGVTFNFITEIFFMSHLSYSCAVHRLHRLLLKINEELSRVQQAYNDATRTQGANRDDVQQLEQTMEKGNRTDDQESLVFLNRFCLRSYCVLEY